MKNIEIITYYSEFRTVIFLSSLTLGTFLFTMKTFIIQTLKKEVYENPLHKSRVRNAAYLSGKNPEYFKNLRGLANLMIWSIYAALINALIQISIGYINTKFSSIFCIATSILSWIVFTRVLYLVGVNMNDLLDFAEEDARSASD